LILILIYFSVYPTPDLLGLLLAGQQSWLCKWVHGLTPVLETTLAEEKQLPVRAGRPEKAMGSINQLLKICPQLSFIIDGVERNVRGPKDSAKPKKATVAKRSAIGLKILSLAIKTEVIFYLSEKVIRAALRIRRWQMKIFQSFLQAVGFGQTRVTKAIFQPLLL